MKILGINGSPRGSHSCTLRLLEAALNGAASKGAKTEFVDICKLNIEFCIGCGVCYKKGKCPRKDDFQALYKKILTADGLVIASPNYFRSITAQLKTVIDRMADAIHCQLLTGKYTVNVATAGGLGQNKQVTDYLNRLMLNFGSFVTGSAGVALRQGPKAFANAEKRAFKLGVALTEDITNKREYLRQRKILDGNRAYFKELVNLCKDEWTYEYNYWNSIEKG